MNGIPREGDERRSLGGKVFTLLREEILNGDFEENEELKENVLANKLGSLPDAGQGSAQAVGA